MKMLNTNMLLTVLIGAMVLVSSLQTLQLVSLTNALAGGRVAVGIGAAVASAPLASSSAAATGSLADLPSMVGGC